MRLVILFWLKTMESLQIGAATHFRVTPLISMRTVLLASLQSCGSVDSDAWCKPALSQCRLPCVTCSEFKYTCNLHTGYMWIKKVRFEWIDEQIESKTIKIEYIVKYISNGNVFTGVCLSTQGIGISGPTSRPGVGGYSPPPHPMDTWNLRYYGIRSTIRPGFPPTRENFENFFQSGKNGVFSQNQGKKFKSGKYSNSGQIDKK